MRLGLGVENAVSVIKSSGYNEREKIVLILRHLVYGHSPLTKLAQSLKSIRSVNGRLIKITSPGTDYITEGTAEWGKPQYHYNYVDNP